jgi:hypothetical protein
LLFKVGAVVETTFFFRGHGCDAHAQEIEAEVERPQLGIESIFQFLFLVLFHGSEINTWRWHLLSLYNKQIRDFNISQGIDSFTPVPRILLIAFEC